LLIISPLLVQVPELNVQNGVLKALSFLFEYIGEMGKDYIYAGG
jgi:splicing factor 3B subunit 1